MPDGTRGSANGAATTGAAASWGVGPAREAGDRPVGGPARGDARETVRSAIARLPQASVIRRDTRERWIHGMLDRFSLEETLWHVRRAGAIGGSDCHIPLLHRDGKRGPFMDLRGLVRQKLLIDLPIPEDQHIARGRRAEPTIRDIAHRNAGAGTIDAAMKAVLEGNHARHPWLKVNPDDIVLVEPTGEAWIWDYKSPSPRDASRIEKYRAGECDFTWVCQLHLIDEACRAQGIAIDHMGIQIFDAFQFDAFLVPVERDEALTERLLASCDEAWRGFVMQGVLPDRIAAKRAIFEADEVPNEVVEASDRFVTLKAIASAAEAGSVQIAETIRAFVAEHGRLGDRKAEFGLATVVPRKAFDIPGLVELVQNLGGDPASCLITDKYDSRKAIRVLNDLSQRAGDLSRRLCGIAVEPAGEDLDREVEAATSEDPESQLEALFDDDPGPEISNFLDAVVLAVQGLSPGYDGEKLAQLVEDLGGDPEPFIGEDLSVWMPRGKCSEADIVDMLKDQASGRLGQLVDNLLAEEPEPADAPAVAEAPRDSPEGGRQGDPEAGMILQSAMEP